MPASDQDVARLGRALAREIQPARIDAVLQNVARASADGSCGAGCGSGCCGAACFAPSPDLAFDTVGHTEINADVLNDIGLNRIGDLRAAIAQSIQGSVAAFAVA